MLAFLFSRAKIISLIGGFLFATGGGAWSYQIVDRLSERVKELSNAKSRLAEEIQKLNTIASEYFIANQQGDLIFILAEQGNARRDLAALIYKGNVLDRATPVRNMIGALALAKELEYRQTYGAYEKLNEQARADFSFANFSKLKLVEQEIISKGQQRVPRLLNQSFEIDKELHALEATQKQNRLLGFLASIFGSLLLLSANLTTVLPAPSSK